MGSLPNVRCRLCPVLSCPVLSCPVLSCPVLSCPVLSCPVLSCPVLSCQPASQPASQFFPYGVVFVSLFSFLWIKSPLTSCNLVLAASIPSDTWQNEPTMKRTQRRKGLHRPPPASTLSSPLYERILQFRALSCLRQQGTDVRRFAQEFSDAAEGLGFNHAALKDMFNSVLDEPLNWWRMRGLDHLSFGEFVGFLARSPAKEAGVPQVAADEAAVPPVAAVEAAVPPVAAVEAAEPPVAAVEAAEPPVAAVEATVPPVAAVEAAEPPVAAEEAAAPPVVADEAAAPPVVTEEAALSRSQKRRRRRKKASSTLQGLEAIPEPSAGQEAIPESPKLLAPPKRLAQLAPPMRLSLPAPPMRLALPAPSMRLSLPAPPRLLVLPAPLKCLALPVPSRILVLPGPPWQPAKLLAPPWPPDGLEPAWSVPPASPWPSTRVPVRPDPPWSVPPAPPWLFARDPAQPDPPWSVPPAPPWLFARDPAWPDPLWSVPPAPPWLPARIPGLCEPPWLNPPVPPWTCWASLLALAWLPSFPPAPLCLCVWLFLSGLLLCVSLCEVRFLCCHVSVLFLVSLIRDARWRPFWGGGSVRVLSLRSSVIHGFVTEPWYSHHVRVFMWARGFECAGVARSLVCVPCFMLEHGVWIPALMSWVSVTWWGSDTRAPFSVIVCARSRVRSAPRTLVHVCFVVLHAVRVSIGCVHLCFILCCVARSLYIHWLRAFMLSCLVWTRGLWVFSLAACSCPVCTWLVICLLAMCLCFCFVWARGFCPSFLCATCSCQFVLTPPILLPVYWFIFPSCFPSLPSSFAPFIISLCLQFRVGSLPNVRCRLCPVQPCPVLSSLVQPASLFFPYGVVFVRLFSFLWIKSPLTSCNWVLAASIPSDTWQ